MLFTHAQRYDVSDLMSGAVIRTFACRQRTKYGSGIESLPVLPLLVFFFHEMNKTFLSSGNFPIAKCKGLWQGRAKIKRQDTYNQPAHNARTGRP